MPQAPPHPAAPSTYALPEPVANIIEPPPDLTVSEWCDAYRRLSSKHSNQPGPYRTAHTPYMREVADALTDRDVQTLVFVKCSRVGGTELINNLIAFTIDARPMPIMYAQPEKTHIHREFGGRLRAMIEDSPRLARHIPEGEWATREKIDLDTVPIYGAWAENPRTMIRETAGLALFDEIDNCEESAGSLGDTLDLLAERVVTFGHRGRIVATGTPTRASASGWQMLLNSTYHRPYVPCPACGHYQILTLDQIKLKPGHEGERDPDAIEIDDLAGYECAHCQTLLDHATDHRWMIDRVVWIPRGQTPAQPLPLRRKKIVAQAVACGPPGHQQWRPRLDGDPPRTKTRGYWINVLYSPWPSRSWSAIFARFLKTKDDPQKFRVFKNAWLAEPWEDAVESTDAAQLRPKIEAGHPEGVIPDDARVLLVGADVQGVNRPDMIYYVLRAWGPRETSWLIRHGHCGTFDELYEIAFHTGFPLASDPARLMRATMLAIDSRHRQSEVLEFAQRPGVMPVRGEQSMAVPHKSFPAERLPNNRPKPGSPRVFHVNTAYFKSKVTRLMQLPPGQPGCWHLHQSTTDDYLRHITNEHQVRQLVRSKRQGGRYEYVWRPKTEGAPVDWWDCEIYNAACADVLNVPLLRDHHAAQGVMTADEIAAVADRIDASPLATPNAPPHPRRRSRPRKSARRRGKSTARASGARSEGGPGGFGGGVV